MRWWPPNAQEPVSLIVGRLFETVFEFVQPVNKRFSLEIAELNTDDSRCHKYQVLKTRGSAR